MNQFKHLKINFTDNDEGLDANKALSGVCTGDIISDGVGVKANGSDESQGDGDISEKRVPGWSTRCLP